MVGLSYKITPTKLAFLEGEFIRLLISPFRVIALNVNCEV